MSARLKPNKVGGRQLEEVRERDPDGRVVRHYRTVDTVGKMLRSGTITPEMHAAAKSFESAFIMAQLDPLRSLPIIRVGRADREPDVSERQLNARRRLDRAMAALGGHGSPGGSVVWFVVGEGTSLRQWALRQRWGGRPVRHEQATGVLVAALAMLAAHYGYRSGDP